MKRFLTSVVGAFIFFASPLAVSAAFSDVPSSHPNYDAIMYVKGEGIVSGYADGTYKPNRLINRAELTKIIVEASLGEFTDTNTSLEGVVFSDVEAGAWYVPYLRSAVKNSIVNGYPDGTFQPSQNISFVEAAKIIVVGFGTNPGEEDIWYQPFVEFLGEKNAIPTSINAFTKSLTRGEMAEIIFRVKTQNTGKSSTNFNALAGIAEEDSSAVEEATEVVEKEENNNNEAQLADPEFTDFTQEKYDSLLGNEAFVLFFRADWCPNCTKLEASIRANLETYPAGTKILKVDYDNSQELKKQYGITIQSSFVVFNANGEVVETLAFVPSMDKVLEAVKKSL